MARLHGMTRDEARERAEHVLEFVGLSDVRHKEVGKYSKGMRQRGRLLMHLFMIRFDNS